ncbi:TATA box binding protein associated factor (TAF), histone-like fold domain [Dillenia turbinata]|uniref:TATA box binding protein associated factor (TAF), histone-like fold domain n=1 Tax=Dillenia turbinata TaxID=194707 RepID=A0AAN8ZHI0_9MAGN
MSTVPKEAIEVIAQSIGITNLAPDVAVSLARDVEYRVREIMQEAIKCMRHSKRTLLTSDDVDSALNLRNVEPIYGVVSGESLRFKRAAGHKDLYYIDEKDVEFREVIEAPLPKAPLDTTVLSHWLAIEGVQPAIPANDALAAVPDNKRPEYKEDGLPIDVKSPVKHVLSRELQLYFDKITGLVVNRSNSLLFKEALVSLATDAGLHPLIPYFSCFIADEVSRNLNDFPLLYALMHVIQSLLCNPHIHIEPYLHLLMPSIITCIVTKRLGNRLSDNHWQLRSFTAGLIASICKRFGHACYDLHSRVTRTLLHCFLDPTKTLPQHFGAIQGLAALGPNVVRLLILPNLDPYMQLLEPEMQPEKQKNEMKRYEAWCVYGALLHAAGRCMYNQLKMSPSWFSLPTRTIWKNNKKIITTMPNKRKASMDNLLQQPPLKKAALNTSVGTIPANSMAVDMQGLNSGFSTRVASDGSLASMTRALSNDNILGSGSSSSRREMQSGKTPRVSSAILSQAWKGIDSGNLVTSLFEIFGERMFSFTPTPELSLFL